MFSTAIYLPFLLGMAQAPVAANAQINKVKGEKHIVVNENKIRVDDLLETFSRQTDLEFSFNSKKISPSKVIPVTHHNQTLTAWLKELEQSTGIRFKVKGDHIILQDIPVTQTNTSALQEGIQESESSSRKQLQVKQSQVKQLQGKRLEVKQLEAKQIPIKQVQAKQGQAKEVVLTAPKQTNEGSLLAPIPNDAIAGTAYRDTPADGLFSQQSALSNAHAETVSREDLHMLFTHELPAPGKTIRPVNRDAVFQMRTLAGKDSIAIINTNPAPPLQPLIKLDAGIQGIGVSFERKMGSKWMIDLSLGMGGGYNFRDGSVHYKWNLTDPAVYVSVNPRFYYNRDRRSKKGRTTSLNAGEYIGMRLKWTTENLVGADSLYSAALINLHWGIQRPIGRKWLVNAHAGIGCAFDVSDFDTKELNGKSFWDKVSPTLYPALECRISYVLNRRRDL